MIKLLTFSVLLIAVSSLHAGDAFTVFEGGATNTPKQPQAFVTTDGVAHLTFGVGDQVYYCQAKGPAISEPKVVGKFSNISLGMRRGPRIAHTGQSIVITAIGGKEGKGRDGDILAYRSNDGGQTWDGPYRVNDVESSAREGLHAMTASNDGQLWCVWLDLRAKETQLYASKSNDHGQTWSKNVLVYRSPDGSVCECCHPSIAVKDSFVHVLFRNSLKGNRDMYLVSSSDNGQTFDTGHLLGNKSWSLNACPMDGGMLALVSTGEIFSAWRRNGTVYATSTEGKTSSYEMLLGNGEQPWICNNSNGTFVTWLTKRDGELRMIRIGSSDSRKIADNARDPVIVSTSANPIVYLFWEQRIGNQFCIMGQTVN